MCTVSRGAIALELVDSVQGDVESVAALVLDHSDFDRALPDEDRLDAAIDADAVLEMHDVVAQLESERVDAATDVPTGAPDAPFAPKDLVVGEHAPTAVGVRWRQDGSAARGS